MDGVSSRRMTSTASSVPMFLMVRVYRRVSPAIRTVGSPDRMVAVLSTWNTGAEAIRVSVGSAAPPRLGSSLETRSAPP